MTEAQLLADVANGFDLLVMGADKWRQVTDPAWYAVGPTDSTATSKRDRALATLPAVLVVPRAGDRPEGVELLDVDEAHHPVNATDVRAGADHARAWMLPEAAAHARRTGAWPSGAG